MCVEGGRGAGVCVGVHAVVVFLVVRFRKLKCDRFVVKVYGINRRCLVVSTISTSTITTVKYYFVY